MSSERNKGRTADGGDPNGAPQKNDAHVFGNAPVGRLVLGTSTPLMISLWVQGLYSLVDSLFVARLGEDALAAVTLVVPLQALMVAFATGAGVGVTATLAQALAEKDPARQNAVCGTALALAGVLYGTSVALGLVGAAVLTHVLPTHAAAAWAATYARVVCVGSLDYHLAVAFEGILRGVGRMRAALAMQVAGAAVNLALDPLLIFGLGNLSGLGVLGAGLATVAGQFVSAGLGLMLCVCHGCIPRRGRSGRASRLRADVVRSVVRVGLPSIAVQAVSSLAEFALNAVLLALSPSSIALYGVLARLQNVAFMPVYGVGNALVPLVAYNRSRGSRVRVAQIVRCGIALGAAVASVFTVLFELHPAWFLALFGATGTMLDQGTCALRTYAASLPLGACALVAGSVLQAAGCGGGSVAVAGARYGAALLLGAIVLLRDPGPSWFWRAFLAAEATGCLAATVLLRRAALLCGTSAQQTGESAPH